MYWVCNRACEAGSEYPSDVWLAAIFDKNNTFQPTTIRAYRSAIACQGRPVTLSNLIQFLSCLRQITITSSITQPVAYQDSTTRKLSCCRHSTSNPCGMAGLLPWRIAGITTVSSLTATQSNPGFYIEICDNAGVAKPRSTVC